MVAAATHGRGLWTQRAISILPVNKFLLRGKWNGKTTDLQCEYITQSSGETLDVEMSVDAVNFINVGSLAASPANTQYNFLHTPNQNKIVYYRIRSNEASGIKRYSNTIKLFKTGADNNVEITSLYPSPAQYDLNIGFTAEKGRTAYVITSLTGQIVWRKEEDLQFTGGYLKNWNISGIKAGTYIFTVISGNKKASQKFVKK